MNRHGLYTLIAHTVRNDDPDIRLKTTSILYSIVDYDATLVRDIISEQAKDNNSPQLLDVLITQFHSEKDEGLRNQLAEILRLLIDFTPHPTFEPDHPQRTPTTTVQLDQAAGDFLEVLYGKFVDRLVKPLTSLGSNNIVRKQGMYCVTPFSPHTPQTTPQDSQLCFFYSFGTGVDVLDLSPDQLQLCFYLCDLVVYMIKSHTFRSKFLIMRSPFLPKVALLCQAKETYIQLGTALTHTFSKTSSDTNHLQNSSGRPTFPSLRRHKRRLLLQATHKRRHLHPHNASFRVCQAPLQPPQLCLSRALSIHS